MSAQDIPASTEETRDIKAMIGDMTSPSILTEEYVGNPMPGFIPGIDYLSSKYRGMRRVRGDGNCFYRAFLFSYLENLVILKENSIEGFDEAEKERQRFINVINESKNRLISLGYEEFTFEYFYDTLIALLNELFTNYTRESLLASFQEDGESDYYTWFMRLLTSLSLRQEADRYMPFINMSEDSSYICTDMESYCKREVEPMGKECEQMQIIAISELLGVVIIIEYLDGKELQEQNTGVNKTLGLSIVECGEGHISEGFEAARKVHLLYRPGHYDILYK